MSPAARNTWVGRVLVEELARLQTPLVCLAPGARCAPISMALATNRRVECVTFVDERAAAYHALGVGRATARPAVVVTTSGTAVGNLVPAAMEADRAGVPLLLLTADRPADLRETGSNQTVRQADALAPLARYRADLPCSDPALSLRAVLSTLDHGVHTAATQRGPVHLNLQFREPLGPDDAETPLSIARWWADADRVPWVRADATAPEPSAAGLARLHSLAEVSRGLVVVGSLPHDARDAVAEAVATLGWPVYASPDSGVAGGRGLDSALSDAELAARLAPDTVLWIGGGIVSKRVVTWLRERSASLAVLSLHDQVDRIDPAFRVRERIVVDYGRLPALVSPGRPAPSWQRDWAQLDRAGAQAVASAAEVWSELSAARTVLSASRSVFVGASLPIRLADWMGAEGNVRIGANRGASGIDGVIATATGWARHVDGPCRVLLGDLTCLHDQGSLPLVRTLGLQAVVFNNRGGSIFGMLPFRDVAGFDEVFRNAHTQRLAPLAQAHGLRTAEVEHGDALEAALADPDVDFVEARFAHDDTMNALDALHGQTRAALAAAWGLS